MIEKTRRGRMMWASPMTAILLCAALALFAGCKGKWTVETVGERDALEQLVAEAPATDAVDAVIEPPPTSDEPLPDHDENLGYVSYSTESAFGLWNSPETFGDYVWIDLRDPEDFEGGQIHGFVNLPAEQVDEWSTGYRTDATLFLVCRGAVRARDTARRLVDLGFVNVSMLEEGIETWLTVYPTTRPEPPTDDADSQ